MSSNYLTEVTDMWAALAAHWERVAGSRRYSAISGPDWIVTEEQSDGSPPVRPADGDEVVVYHGKGEDRREVGRWPLEDVAEYDLEDKQ